MSDANNTFVICAKTGNRPFPQWMPQKPSSAYKPPKHGQATITIDNTAVSDKDGSPSHVACGVISSLGCVVGKSSDGLEHLHFGRKAREERSEEPYEVSCLS